MRMKINYCVYRLIPYQKKRKKAPRRESLLGSIFIDVAWESDGGQQAILNAIRAKHPGYMVDGYCRIDEVGDGQKA